MKVLFSVLLLCGFALAADSPIAEATCTVTVARLPEWPAAIVQPPITEVHQLARCEDVKFQGGGVVIRALSNAGSGKWYVRYYPAHKLESVTVTPKE